MNDNDVRATLQKVFQEVFEDEEFEFSDGLGRETLKTWDSLGHIRLVAAVEEAFGTTFSIEEIESFTTVGKIVDTVTKQD
jgi:acyl carrier protein